MTPILTEARNLGRARRTLEIHGRYDGDRYIRQAMCVLIVDAYRKARAADAGAAFRASYRARARGEL